MLRRKHAFSRWIRDDVDDAPFGNSSRNTFKKGLAGTTAAGDHLMELEVEKAVS